MYGFPYMENAPFLFSGNFTRGSRKDAPYDCFRQKKTERMQPDAGETVHIEQRAFGILKEGREDMDDSQIIQLYFDRDEHAIAETSRKYGALCYRIAGNILRSHEDAEECVNDVYLRLWNAIPPACPDSLPAYICRIARNLALKKFESVHAEKRSPDVTVPLSEIEAFLPDERALSAAAQEGLSSVINRFLSGEKEETRNVFVRRYWFFDSVHDIAEQYAVSESKVKSILFRTRKKLRRHLEKEGYEI